VKTNEFLKRFLADESGATAVEYALIVALIAAAIIIAVTGLGTAIKDKFTEVSTSISNAGK